MHPQGSIYFPWATEAPKQSVGFSQYVLQNANLRHLLVSSQRPGFPYSPVYA